MRAYIFTDEKQLLIRVYIGENTAIKTTLTNKPTFAIKNEIEPKTDLPEDIATLGEALTIRQLVNTIKPLFDKSQDFNQYYFSLLFLVGIENNMVTDAEMFDMRMTDTTTAPQPPQN